MENDGKFLIYVDETHYWDLSLIPEKNECDEDCNRCALIDSEKGVEVDAVMFDSEWLLPIFSARSMIGMKQLAQQLKTITDKHGIVVKPRDEMPKDKKAQEVKHIGKKRF
jgi:wyosine [tRNA(Phe)-imidazoG37] synthetase (radical SAM superfamily)